MELNKSNCYILRKVDVVKVEDDFIVKPLLCVVDEMTEIMEGSNYRAVESIKNSISSIARLGRAAACHLCLATQRPSGSVISADLKNNIQLGTILGDFGTSESTLVLDDDFSANAKPKIKGRGFVKSGQEIVEYQSYFVDLKTCGVVEKDGFYKNAIDLNVEERVPDIDKHMEAAEEIEREIEIPNKETESIIKDKNDSKDFLKDFENSEVKFEDPFSVKTPDTPSGKRMIKLGEDNSNNTPKSSGRIIKL